MKKVIALIVILVCSVWSARWDENRFIIGTLWSPTMLKNGTTATDNARLEKFVAAHFNLMNTMLFPGAANWQDSLTPFIPGQRVGNSYTLQRITDVNAAHGQTVLKALVGDFRLFGRDTMGQFTFPWQFNCYTTTTCPGGYNLNAGQIEAVAGYETAVDEPSMAELIWKLLRVYFPHANNEDSDALVVPVLSDWKIFGDGSGRTYEQHWTYFDTGYVSRYLRQPDTKVIAFDYYLLSTVADTYSYWATGGQVHYYRTLELFAERSQSVGKRFWGVPNASEYNIYGPATAHYDPSEVHLRFNAFSNLIYGAKGLMWYNYGYPGEGNCGTTYPLNCEKYFHTAENDTDLYIRLQQINSEIKAMGPTLMKSKWITTVHGAATDPQSDEPNLPEIGSSTPVLSPDVIPDAHIAIGIFKDTVDTRVKYLAVFNKDLNGSQNVSFSVRGCPAISIVDKGTGYPYGFGFGCYGTYAEVHFYLGAGDMQLVSVTYGGNFVAKIDYDGDSKADISELYLDAWEIDYSTNGFGSVDVTATPHSSYWKGAPADYDGDGLTDIATYTYYGNFWEIDYAVNGFNGIDSTHTMYGSSVNALPVPADYDGDGIADLALFSNSGDSVSGYLIDYAANGFSGPDFSSWYFSLPSTDHPTPADYDGDGKADLSLKNDYGQWRIDYASNGYLGWDSIYSGYGDSNYIPAPTDFDGDGKADLVVMHKASSGNGWGIDYSDNGFSGIDAWYNASITYSYTKPMPSDYDGDGYADIAVKNDDGYWAVDYASNSFGSWDVVSGSWGDGTAQPFHKSMARDLQVKNLKEEVTLAFSLSKSIKVKIQAYDVHGKLIATLHDGDMSEGTNSLRWSKKQYLASKGLNRGVYFLSFKAGDFKASKRLMLTD